jgi:hypothetical protein
LGNCLPLNPVLATLGKGEHYLFDLIAAVPYTLLILHLAKTPWFSSTSQRLGKRKLTSAENLSEPIAVHKSR